jgi:hypothetical protein
LAVIVRRRRGAQQANCVMKSVQAIGKLDIAAIRRAASPN